jgi:large subunit ribosomal protein L9
MKVILVNDMNKLGHAGEVVNVAPGYARNYLLPRGMALQATPGNLGKAENIRKKADDDRAARLRALQEMATKINGVELNFKRKADENGHLFGSVSELDIIQGLHEKGTEVTKQMVEMEKHMKELGAMEVKIHLTSDLSATLKVVVENEE